MTAIRPRPRSRDRHRAAPCSRCRRTRKRTPAASPGPACSRRTTPTLLQVLRKNGAEQPVVMYPGWAPGMNAIHSSRGSRVVTVLPPGRIWSRRRPKVKQPA